MHRSASFIPQNDRRKEKFQRQEHRPYFAPLLFVARNREKKELL
jgi:hypothetical protein